MDIVHVLTSSAIVTQVLYSYTSALGGNCTRYHSDVTKSAGPSTPAFTCILVGYLRAGCSILTRILAAPVNEILK
jgi:hypothetical protein